jgi:UDP-glucuronate decarboxylase
MIRLMNTPDGFTGPVNIGNPNEFTILQLAENVIRLTGSSSRIVKLPLPSDDPMMRQPDISQARKELNWSPKTELEEGLLKTIHFFKSVIE